MKKLRDKLMEFEEKDVYNMDETAFYWQQSSDDILGTKQLHRTKQSKAYFTACMCSNADGSDKCLISLIGCYLKLQVFKNIIRSQIEFYWHASKIAWNNTVLMTEWLIWFNQQVQRLRVALLFHNITSYANAVVDLQHRNKL